VLLNLLNLSLSRVKSKQQSLRLTKKTQYHRFIIVRRFFFYFFSTISNGLFAHSDTWKRLLHLPSVSSSVQAEYCGTVMRINSPHRRRVPSLTQHGDEKLEPTTFTSSIESNA
jgi:hypothetical protein